MDSSEGAIDILVGNNHDPQLRKFAEKCFSHGKRVGRAEGENAGLERAALIAEAFPNNFLPERIRAAKSPAQGEAINGFGGEVMLKDVLERVNVTGRLYDLVPPRPTTMPDDAEYLLWLFEWTCHNVARNVGGAEHAADYGALRFEIVRLIRNAAAQDTKPVARDEAGATCRLCEKTVPPRWKEGVSDYDGLCPSCYGLRVQGDR